MVFTQCLLDGLAVEESQNLLPILLILHGLKSYVCLMPHKLFGFLTPGSRKISTCNFEYPVLWASGQLFGKSRKEALCNASAAAVEQCLARSTKAPSDDNGHGCLFEKVYFIQDSVLVLEYSKIMLVHSPYAAAYS